MPEIFSETITFNILKSPSLFERIVVVLLFVLLFFGFIYIGPLVFLWLGIPYDKLTAKMMMIILLPLLYFLERRYDKKVRGRIIGDISLDKKGLIINQKNCSTIEFKNVKMLWINFGMNTVTEKRTEYKFSDFETIKIKIIDLNDESIFFHVNNHANNNKTLISDYLDYLKKHHHFFKIHFHDQTRFSKKEYFKTLKRYSIMQSSLIKRNGKPPR